MMRGSQAPEGRSIRVNLAMSNDTAIQSVAAVGAGNYATTEAKLQTTSEQLPRAELAPAASPITNPSLRLDAALGIVVIEFRNDSGAITTSVPSQHQLQAYQRWAQTHSGLTPHDGAMTPNTPTAALTQYEADSDAKGAIQHPGSHRLPPVSRS
jgi:hypothetical protein